MFDLKILLNPVSLKLLREYIMMSRMHFFPPENCIRSDEIYRHGIGGIFTTCFLFFAELLFSQRADLRMKTQTGLGLIVSPSCGLCGQKVATDYNTWSPINHFW